MPVGGGAPVARTADRGARAGFGARRLGAGAAAGVRWVALAGEGGHATMAPATERESAVLDLMRRRFDHVSAERCSRGPASSISTTAWRRSTGCRRRRTPRRRSPIPEIGAQDPLCREATEMFCAMLGTVAGNLALTLGAQGGVYIAGGIVPQLGARFAESAFRERFEAKGRMQPLSRGDPDLCRDPPAAGLSRLRRRAGEARRARSPLGVAARRRGAAGR